jgi:Raf kinase inhibitor-like YbhB/YbcL family protein
MKFATLFSALAAVVLTIPSAQAAKGFTLKSEDISGKGMIAMEQVYNAFGCTGSNVSPALTWENAPAGTKSFAVTMYDPDAPTGSGWWHWTVYNIPATYKGLPKGFGKTGETTLADGIMQGRTDFGTAGYGGPCPPQGDKPHRYVIAVFALKTERLDVPENATAAMIGFNLNAQKLGLAKVTGTFGRKK